MVLLSGENDGVGAAAGGDGGVEATGDGDGVVVVAGINDHGFEAVFSVVVVGGSGLGVGDGDGVLATATTDGDRSRAAIAAASVGEVTPLYMHVKSITGIKSAGNDFKVINGNFFIGTGSSFPKSRR